jgi:squalene monooxygenase
MVQAVVSQLLEDNEGVHGVVYKEGNVTKEVHAPLTIVCDGCFSNLRKRLGAPKPDTKSYFVGVILNDCKLPFEYCGNVILASPGPVLGYQVTDL